MTTNRDLIAGISPYEEIIGFSRAVRIDDRILVSGTGPVQPDGGVPPDAAAQARRCFELIGAALAQAGASLEDVVRTRMYITSGAHAAAVGSVHRDLFEGARPAATMVIVAGLLDDRWVVEVEAEAFRRGGGK
ncbi:RidA family protein [Frankia sp. R82]|uniref:RidA family protein n=1 Tax=Frankia sp. R82 TaxID=2950553 RepID=UPI002043D6E1|nr:RidA family protein [Frankia sp. R82]MCM3883604.1 RidA family protein [Frankia sp. R82]